MNYYEVGNRQNPVYSNSAGSYLNPEQGGSIQKYLGFFDKFLEKKESSALEHGKLLHRYIEELDNFIVSDIEKPSGMMGELIDELEKQINDYIIAPELYPEVDTIIKSDLKTENGRKADMLEAEDAYDKLAEQLKLPKDNLIKCFRVARRVTNVYTSYGEGKVVLKVLSEGIKYLEFLKRKEGKVVLEKNDKEKLENSKLSLYNNKFIRELLDLEQKRKNTIVLKEFELYLDIPSLVPDSITVNGKFVKYVENVKVNIPAKLKIDRVEIFPDEKRIVIVDLKSSKGSIYTFLNSFSYYQYDRQFGFYYTCLLSKLNEIFENYNLKFSSDWKILFKCPVVESSGLYLSTIYNINNDVLFVGREKSKLLIQRLAWHKYHNIYDTSIEEYFGNGEINLNCDMLNGNIKNNE